MSKPPQTDENITKNPSESPVEPVSLDARAARIEALLREQAKDAKNSLRLRAISFGLNCVCVLAVAVFLAVFGTSAYRMTQNVSHLTQTAEASLTELTDSFNSIAEGIDKIDFDAVSSSFEELQSGLGEMDFEALADSIEHLQEVAARLAKVTSIFG